MKCTRCALSDHWWGALYEFCNSELMNKAERHRESHRLLAVETDETDKAWIARSPSKNNHAWSALFPARVYQKDEMRALRPF